MFKKNTFLQLHKTVDSLRYIRSASALCIKIDENGPGVHCVCGHWPVACELAAKLIILHQYWTNEGLVQAVVG